MAKSKPSPAERAWEESGYILRDNKPVFFAGFSAREDKTCEWKYTPANEHQNPMLYSECGYSRQLTNSNTNELDYKYCPYCSGKIVEVEDA